ncbi:MAG: AbrB/MazE/SpoVT family DNA-binding domain-containing protein [Coriobacteriia bacterium]|jgi:AbrB family looped-hinge helix DNA binding protein|nr:AbrB/MazE/SpoVT family DNA-binding domain-containing protein [Coriobacteriia bacterium]MDR2714077.1 AbrB/MazE/SpoVT family DNA-binding domain-containing protein [Coriobacteriales bacterium]
MELATVTSKGQVTIPSVIRRKLDLKTGSKLLFFEDGEKVVIKKNDPEAALEAIQSVLAPLAAEQGILTDDDVMMLVKEYRSRKKIK